jgi:hypothetical protein
MTFGQVFEVSQVRRTPPRQLIVQTKSTINTLSKNEVDFHDVNTKIKR